MKSFMDGMKAVREGLEKEVPAWQKLIHDAEIKESKDSYDEWLVDEELRAKREDFTAKKAKKD